MSRRLMNTSSIFTLVIYALQTNVVLICGVDEDKFAEHSSEFFAAISKSDACAGCIW